MGAGGHAKVLLESLLQDTQCPIAGFLEIEKNLIGKIIGGFQIFNQQEILEKFISSEINLVNGIGSIDKPLLRGSVFEQLKTAGFCFQTILHSHAYCSKDVVLREGVQLMARSTVLTGVKIGANSIVNTSASIDHDCRIGQHVHIAPGVILCGEVTIGDYCHIGVGAKIVQGITIGAGSVVGAGAVVISNLPAGSRVAGVPAKSLV